MEHDHMGSAVILSFEGVYKMHYHTIKFLYNKYVYDRTLGVEYMNTICIEDFVSFLWQRWKYYKESYEISTYIGLRAKTYRQDVLRYCTAKKRANQTSFDPELLQYLSTVDLDKTDDSVEKLQHAIKLLKPNYKLLIQQFYFSDMTIHELAALNQCTTKSIHVMLQRAILHLRLNMGINDCSPVRIFRKSRKSRSEGVAAVPSGPILPLPANTRDRQS